MIKTIYNLDYDGYIIIQQLYEGGFRFTCTSDEVEDDDARQCGYCGAPEGMFYSFEHSREDVERLIKQLTELLDLPIVELPTTTIK